MKLPEINLYPAFNTLRLSHVILNVKNINISKEFYSNILGLQITHESSDSIYFRCMEERGHHSLIIKESTNPSCEVIGFKVFSEKDLELAEKYFRNINHKTKTKYGQQ